MDALRERFYKNLYRSYHQGASFGHFISGRITALAWLFLALLVTSFIMGGNLESSVVILMSALLLGVIIVSFIWAFLRRGKVSVSRLLPETGSVDEPLSYRVRVTNVGKRPLYDIRVAEAEDDPRPTQWEFLNLKEPGEDERNIFDRIFIFYRWKWLSERGGKWEVAEDSNSFSIAAGESREMTLKLIPRRRGVIELQDIRVVLPDPFGLFQRRKKTLGDPREVLIVPKRYRLPRFELGGQSELKVGGETASIMRGEGGDFLGLREYRPGDPMRKIHWKSWARRGIPVVKQHEENRFARYGLVLDTNLEKSSPMMFEECVSIAASFVSTMDRSHCLLDLMFVRDQPEVYTAGRGTARASQLMEVLARVEANEEGGYQQLEKLIRRYASELTAAVVVLSGWDQEREDFVNNLLALGVQAKVFALIPPEGDLQTELAVHALRFDQVEQDLFAQVS